jgi:hypothetical protein
MASLKLCAYNSTCGLYAHEFKIDRPIGLIPFYSPQSAFIASGTLCMVSPQLFFHPCLCVLHSFEVLV